MATIYYRDLNPFGPQSVPVFLVFLAVAALTSRYSIIPKKHRAMVEAVAAVTFAASALYWSGAVGRFWDAQDDVTLITLAAASFGFAWSCRRFQGRGYMIVCCAFTTTTGAFLSFWAGGKLQYILSDGYYHPPYTRWMAAMLFSAVWTGVLLDVYRRRRRERLQGKCHQCEYDLRGNSAATHCPECGEPVRPDAFIGT